ncbi:MAG: phosphopyruvate hydratase [Patescibacteria group bacterium]
MENKIDKIEAEEIFDSRGNPTLKVSVYSGDMSASFSVPSGASTGIHEAHELRDVDGKGVNHAIGKINTILSEALVGMSILDQKGIDQKMIELDGTTNKDSLGGNSLIGISIACVKLGAKILKIPLYQYLSRLTELSQNSKITHLFINLINGGKHAKNNLAFQEYHIVTFTDDIKEAVDISLKIQNSLQNIILRELGEESIVLGDEGGFAPKVTDVRTPLLYLREAIIENDLEEKVRISLDVAASSFYKEGVYTINGKSLSKEDLMNLYNSLIQEFKLFSIEDPFNEEDFESFALLRNKHKELIVAGDDLTVTNKALLEKAIQQKSVNGMIIKPNQIGTISETLDTIVLAIQNDVKLIISHRSGETDDDFIADLVYAVGAFGLKSGSPRKSERMVKYQRLIQIKKEI